MPRPRLSPALLSLCLVFSGCSRPLERASAPQSKGGGEMIVLIRHGEKPFNGLGQLTCKGLNRALALPSLLIGRYGKPDYIYAPDPAAQVHDTHLMMGQFYSYVRPLATIEPTAIRLGMPVNTQLGFTQIDTLQQQLVQPAYAHATVYVAWEHGYLNKLARQMLANYGGNPSMLPAWPGGDYETIYVFHITRAAGSNTPHATLDIQSENLGNTLSDTCPGPQ